MDDSGGATQPEPEAAAGVSTRTEPVALQWPTDREPRGPTDREPRGPTDREPRGPTDREPRGQTGKAHGMSVRSSEAASCTESDRELIEERGGPTTHPEEPVEEPVENQLPDKAAQVFSPAGNHFSPSPREENQLLWDPQPEQTPFLAPAGLPQLYSPRGLQEEWAEDRPPASCGRGCFSRSALKVGVSVMTSALLFPFLVWGGFVFLPFDAPLMDGTPPRLIYTLRCSIFATIPIVLGWLVLGIARLRSGAVRPLFDEQVKGEGLRDFTVHRRYISDSVSLFLIYFLQLVVMAMYLSQENLKLIPLLTIVFAFGRLVYWAAAAFGSSVRGFGGVHLQPVSNWQREVLGIELISHQ
ncbi:transmembrane protein 79 isoform X2 [Betta splendens]|uniref:Transmembrane protein 79 isoform X2 n=1 Tax=Betta splendens TaxID=158456 RepID=A0A6P7KN87_BETSP|nr:transmembrane protein 79 isoform X2 [Betta splendens]